MTIIAPNEIYSPRYHALVEITKKHERAHWTEDEVKLQQDVEQWKTGLISEQEKYLITNILRLFTQSDHTVASNYYDKLIPFFKNPEVRDMFGSFAAREGIHKRGYALLTDTLGFGEGFYSEFLEYKEMREKHEFMIENVGNSYADMGAYLAKQVMMEGVSLFAMFATLLNFDRLGKLPGMSDLNKWSINDESIHAEGLAAVFRIFCEEHPRIVTDDFKKDIYETTRKLVHLEDLFVDRAFSIGGVFTSEGEAALTAAEVKRYVRYIADYRLTQLGLKRNWNVKENPLPWMDWLTGSTFGNFFERAIVEYSKANLTGNLWDGITLEEDLNASN